MQAEAPEEYELLVHEEVVADEKITVENTMKNFLYWIDFRVAAPQQALIEDAFGSFNNVRVLTEKDISTMASNFSSRTQSIVRLNFLSFFLIQSPGRWPVVYNTTILKIDILSSA